MLTPPSDPAVAADATRRAFLKKVAIGGAAAAIGTQVLPLRAFAQEGGSEDEGDSGGDDPTTETTAPGTEGEGEESAVELTPDEQRVTFLAGIALAGATIYRAAAGDEATAEDEDDEEGGDEAATPSSTTTLPAITVPPLAEPVVEVLRVFGSHHSQQATGLSTLLTTVVDAPNGTLVAEVRGALGSAADEAAVLSILRDLEERIAATHLQALADIEDANDAQLIATALPVVSQHATVLGLVSPTEVGLDELVPEAQTTDGALDEAAYPTDGTSSSQDTPGTPEEDANPGGEGVDPDSSSSGGSEDGTESSGGGAADGTDTGAGSAADPESEG